MWYCFLLFLYCYVLYIADIADVKSVSFWIFLGLYNGYSLKKKSYVCKIVWKLNRRAYLLSDRDFHFIFSSKRNRCMPYFTSAKKMPSDAYTRLCYAVLRRCVSMIACHTLSNAIKERRKCQSKEESMRTDSRTHRAPQLNYKELLADFDQQLPAYSTI